VRILHIDTGRDMRGGQWQALCLLRGLASKGIGGRLLARGELLRRATEEGFECALATFWNTVRNCRDTGFDAIHAHDAKAHSWAAMSLSTTPLLVARRVIYPVKTGLLSQWKYGRARHFIAISRAVRAALEHAGVASGKISVVPDGVSVPESVVPFGMRKIAIGLTKDPDLRVEGVEFGGNLADQLPDARVMVYLSRSEGLGSAALMAMAHAVPVIASRVGGLQEVVEPGVTGLLVDSPSEAAVALQRLESDPRMAERMGEAGRERVLAQFTIERMVDATVQVYRKTLGQHPGIDKVNK
jgi:hypothetical protein